MGRWISAVVLGIAIGFALGWLLRPIAPTEAPEGKPQFELGSSAGTKVATFDGGTLTEDELRAFVATAPADQKPKVDDALMAEIASARALASGAAQDPLIAARLKRALADAWQNAELDALAKTTAQDEAALKAWYEAHRTEFVRPEKVVVQHAVIATVAGKEKEALAKARTLEKAGDGFFAEATKLGVVRERAMTKPELEGELGAESAEKAFLMVRIGEVQLYETKGAVHVLRLLRREGPLDESFEKARAQVASRRWYELRAAALDQMKARLLKESAANVDQAAAEKVLGK